MFEILPVLKNVELILDSEFAPNTTEIQEADVLYLVKWHAYELFVGPAAGIECHAWLNGPTCVS